MKFLYDSGVYWQFNAEIIGNTFQNSANNYDSFLSFTFTSPFGFYGVLNNTFYNLSGEVFVYHFSGNDITDDGSIITQSDARFFMNC